MDLLARVRDEVALEANIRKSYLYRFLMSFQLWWPIWVIYLQKQRGLSLTQITLLDTPFFLLVVLAEVPTGAIADRFGRRVSLMLGSSLFAVAVFIFGIADNYAIILLSYTAWGLAQTFQSGADAAILYDSLKRIGREDDFQRINGRLWALTSAAVLIAILIGAPIAQATSYSFPIILSAFIAIAALPVAFSMHEPLHAPEGAHEHYLETLVRGVRDAWETPTLRYIILFSAVMMTATFTPLVFQQPFLAKHGVGTASLGIWQAPVRAAGIVAALVAGRYVTKLGQRAAFLSLPLVLGICNLALFGIDHAWIAAGFIGIGFAAGIQNPVLATYVNKRIPSERRATMLSAQSVVGNFIFAGTQPLAGVIADTLGLRAVFLAFGVSTLLAGVTVLTLWQRAEDEEERQRRTLTDHLLGRDAERERSGEAMPV